jgi:hypothetical protein
MPGALDDPECEAIQELGVYTYPDLFKVAGLKDSCGDITPRNLVQSAVHGPEER